jgi:hypothetical protein
MLLRKSERIQLNYKTERSMFEFSFGVCVCVCVCVGGGGGYNLRL